MRVTIGIDVGQRVDPTAISVTQLTFRRSVSVLPGAPAYEDHHIVRHLERLPLGTPYPRIVDRLADVVRAVEERVRSASLVNRGGDLVMSDAAEVVVYMDATGVGTPVVDLLLEAGVPVIPVYFTHGDRRKVNRNDGGKVLDVTLGKAYMVARMQAILQTRRLHLPKTEDGQQLARELLDYEIKVDQNANDKYGAFKVGAHDDLVTAVGLTVQEAPALMGSALSAGGHMPAPVPGWASAHTQTSMTGKRLPGLGGSDLTRYDTLPTLPPFGGLNAWEDR